MQIRAAGAEDIPAIVNLLKISLGEALMPKSEAFWRWKHLENPFGVSSVLLAFEGNLLIGVRAFMRWNWKQGERTYKAIRAVDTTTHPQHQGKGVFKALTLQLVDQCRAEGFDFIFNTPNANSKPGYLKMGWISQGKMKVSMRPVLAIKKVSNTSDARYSMDSSRLVLPISLDQDTTRMQTAVSEKFLAWRYATNPNIRYSSFSDSQNNPSYLTIFRLKRHRLGTEFRVCDIFHSDSINTKEYSRHLMQVVKESGANLITASRPIPGVASISVATGPEITTRALSFDHNFLSFNFWKPTLGDMEVF